MGSYIKVEFTGTERSGRAGDLIELRAVRTRRALDVESERLLVVRVVLAVVGYFYEDHIRTSSEG